MTLPTLHTYIGPTLLVPTAVNEPSSSEPATSRSSSIRSRVLSSIRARELTELKDRLELGSTQAREGSSSTRTRLHKFQSLLWLDEGEWIVAGAKKNRDLVCWICRDAVKVLGNGKSSYLKYFMGAWDSWACEVDCFCSAVFNSNTMKIMKQIGLIWCAIGILSLIEL
jgi:hypothetical protein